MPIINSLKNTTLKSLRYTGLGPAVQKDINNPPVYNSFSREAEARGDDAQRIARAIIFDSPQFTTNLAQLNAIDQGRRRKPEQRAPNDIPRGVASNSVGKFFNNLGQGIRDIANTIRDEVELLASSAVQTPSIIAATLAQVAASSGTHFVYGFGIKGKYIPGIASPHVLAQLQGKIPIPADFDPLADGNLLLDRELKNPSKISAYDFVKSKSKDSIGDGVIKDFTKVEETPTGKAPLKISNEIKKETRIGLSTNRKLGKYTDKYIKRNPGKLTTYK